MKPVVGGLRSVVVTVVLVFRRAVTYVPLLTTKTVLLVYLPLFILMKSRYAA